MKERIDLYEKLTEEDIQKISEYYYRWGIHGINHWSDEINDYIAAPVDKGMYIPLKEFLEKWSICKNTLYKLLGNQMIYKIPFNYEKPENDIAKECSVYLDSVDALSTLRHCIDEAGYWIPPLFDHIFEKRALINNLTNYDIFLRPVDDTGSLKERKIPSGTKVFRAVGKILKYCNADKEIIDFFEKVRIKISLILNEKELAGNLCFSIHPLDFMTMSDNNSDWSSCMSWKRSGCYRVGSYEMMNSNNALCCYLESNSRMMGLESDNSDAKDNPFWNDKKWRSLLFVNKDIVVSGKSYPYKNDTFSKKLIEVIRELAEKNLGWTYKFGIEPYKDMLNVNSLDDYIIDRDLENSKDRNNFIPKKIYFTNNAMYNDMCNDNYYGYWCVRNPIHHTRKINISGPVICISCGKPLLEFDTDHDDYDEPDWNDRYKNTEDLICKECSNTKKCEHCGDFVGPENLFTFDISDYSSWDEDYNDDVTVTRCRNCIKGYYICPCCGKPFLLGETPIERESNIAAFYLKDDDVKKYMLTEKEADQKAYNCGFWRDENKISYEYENRFKDLKYCYENLKPNTAGTSPKAAEFNETRLLPEGRNAEPLYMCPACLRYFRDHKKEMLIRDCYVYSYYYLSSIFNESRLTSMTFINNGKVDEKEVEKYFFSNLKKFEV